jgi:hypothetical protein
MEREQVIALAREAGLLTDEITLQFLERFAALVAEATKEKAARACDERDDAYGTFTASDCAAAIRSMK